MKTSSSGSGSASVAEQVKEEDGAWAAVEEELVWFEEMAKTEDDEGERDAVVEDLGDTSDSDEDEAFIIAETVESSGTAELYDSGCTNHISPYRSSNIAYTLVSIGRLNDKGNTAKFGKGKCVLEGPDGEKIGEVLRTMRKAYKVEHEEMANAAEETFTLDRLHR